MSDEPIQPTVDATEAFGEGLIFLHQTRTAIVMSPKQAGIVGRQLLDASKLGVIGREYSLMKMVTKKIHKALHTVYEHTEIRDTHRGCYFEVLVTLPDGEKTGRVARVTVELDRVEEV
jgi:hypothetical protein